MINKEIAEIVKAQSLRAIEELSDMLFQVQGKCPDEDFNGIRRGVGDCIIEIQTELLDPIYRLYPELDDLK
jgi:hypothetical protein